jgi:hypothetical protein
MKLCDDADEPVFEFTNPHRVNVKIPPVVPPIITEPDDESGVVKLQLLNVELKPEAKLSELMSITIPPVVTNSELDANKI